MQMGLTAWIWMAAAIAAIAIAIKLAKLRREQLEGYLSEHVQRQRKWIRRKQRAELKRSQDQETESESK